MFGEGVARHDAACRTVGAGLDRHANDGVVGVCGQVGHGGVFIEAEVVGGDVGGNDVGLAHRHMGGGVNGHAHEKLSPCGGVVGDVGPCGVANAVESGLGAER